MPFPMESILLGILRASQRRKDILKKYIMFVISFFLTI